MSKAESKERKKKRNALKSGPKNAGERAHASIFAQYTYILNSRIAFHFKIFDVSA